METRRHRFYVKTQSKITLVFRIPLGYTVAVISQLADFEAGESSIELVSVMI
jgi:hypothetical protein